MSDHVIEVENLGKQYRINPSGQGYNLLSEQLGRLFKSPFGKSRASANKVAGSDLFWALKDVSFQVERGKVVGVIGGNGSGKSTLLKIMSRVTEPTTGRIVLNGRVSSLLEINVGFHPELTGRENIYLLGTILGLRRSEITFYFDEIVDFADMRQFLDTPVKHYSSGMFLRLGFAVAAHLQPEILFVDEVLAVGDAAFQRKCIARMQSVAKDGRTVLIVSHQLDTIRRLSDSCLVLNKGQLRNFDNVDEAIEEYIKSVGLGDETSLYCAESETDGPVQILQARILDASGQTRKRFDFLENVFIELEYEVRQDYSDIYFELLLSKNGEAFFSSWDIDTNPERLAVRPAGRYRSTIEIPAPFIKPGHHTLTFNIMNRANSGVFQRLEHILGFEIELLTISHDLVSYSHGSGNIAIPLEWVTTAQPKRSVGESASESLPQLN